MHFGFVTDLVLRNGSTGAFQVYNNSIVNAAPLGAVGLNWRPR
jgi:hypothetical protein